jgi:hypothetical protein
MWIWVLAGMAQTKQVVRVGRQGIAVSTFKPDHVFQRRGEMRSV